MYPLSERPSRQPLPLARRLAEIVSSSFSKKQIVGEHRCVGARRREQEHGHGYQPDAKDQEIAGARVARCARLGHRRGHGAMLQRYQSEVRFQSREPNVFNWNGFGS